MLEAAEIEKRDAPTASDARAAGFAARWELCVVWCGTILNPALHPVRAMPAWEIQANGGHGLLTLGLHRVPTPHI